MSAANTSREIVRRFLKAIHDQDLGAMRELAHPEFEDFYPQSGELTRGVANFEAILNNYPGKMEGLGQDRIIGGEDRFVRSPLFTIIRVEGNDDVMTGIQRARYPDGSVWFVIAVVEVRDALVYRSQTFFAPAFEPPEWRAPYVEIRPRPGE